MSSRGLCQDSSRPNPSPSVVPAIRSPVVGSEWCVPDHPDSLTWATSDGSRRIEVIAQVDHDRSSSC